MTTVQNAVSEQIEYMRQEIVNIAFNREFQGKAWGEWDTGEFMVRLETDGADIDYAVIDGSEVWRYDSKEDFIEDLTDAIEQAMIDF